MKRNIYKLGIGLLLQGLGIALVVASGTTFPITALYLGISKTFLLSYGTASLLVELVTILINCCFKEKIGWATISSAILNGYLVDLFSLLIPSIKYSILYLPIGALIMCFGFYFISVSGLGLNSSNGLMNAMQKLTKQPVKVIRTCEEVAFMSLGWLLGGTVNVGTIILSCCFGFLLNFVYNKLHFKPIEVQHKYISFKCKSKEKEIIVEA